MAIAAGLTCLGVGAQMALRYLSRGPPVPQSRPSGTSVAALRYLSRGPPVPQSWPSGTSVAALRYLSHAPGSQLDVHLIPSKTLAVQPRNARLDLHWINV